MAIPVIPEDEVSGSPRRVWWAYLPALMVFGLLLYVVPFGFFQMHSIHSGLIHEFDDVPGHEIVESNVNWYPSSRGGFATLRPVEGGKMDDLRAHIRELGYGDGRVGGDWIPRARPDPFDSDMVKAIENQDGTVTVNVWLSDTDLVAAWPLLLTMGAVVFFVLLSMGRAAEAVVLRRRSGPRRTAPEL